MSTLHSPEVRDEPRSRVVRRVWLALIGLVAMAVIVGGSLLMAWAVDETHFARPDERFTELATRLGDLPGVDDVEADRWVEAPFFADPTSSIIVTVDESGLAGFIDAGCSADHPDAIGWAFRVRTTQGAAISLFADSTAGTPCPDFGFDAVPLVHAIDAIAPGVDVQPMFLVDGDFVLTSIGDPPDASPDGYSELLPLLARGDEVLRAAGLDEGLPVSLNAMTLDVTTAPEERRRYVDVLTELADDHGVTSFFSAEAESMADGTALIQVVAPASQHPAIESAIRASGLEIADHPVRFLDP